MRNIHKTQTYNQQKSLQEMNFAIIYYNIIAGNVLNLVIGHCITLE
jgi:hypothetical protein